MYTRVAQKVFPQNTAKTVIAILLIIAAVPDQFADTGKMVTAADVPDATKLMGEEDARETEFQNRRHELAARFFRAFSNLSSFSDCRK